VTVDRQLIEITDLHYAYHGLDSRNIEALRGVSCTVNPGEFVAVVGANGSGKTTLARHLNGLLVPTSGSVRVGGLDTREPSVLPRVRSLVSMVFQRPEDQIVATTIEDDVAFGPENLGLPHGEITSRVRWALETVGLWSIRQRPPGLLSVGQQQRVAIAGALAMRPSCLVLDEASAMLNPRGRRELITLLERLHAEGTTIILITHWMSEAAEADRLVALDTGRISFDGTPGDFFADISLVASMGLDHPPLMELGIRLRELWPDFPIGLMTPEEMVRALLPRIRQSEPLASGTLSVDTSGEEASDLGSLELEVENLGYTYLYGTPLAATALAGVDLRIARGGVMGLVGPTGSGKSTLLQHAAALLRPESGDVLLRGRNIHDTHFDRRELRAQVGLLFQRSEEQLFESYVGDDVAFGPRQFGLDRLEVRERVRWAMDVVGLPFDEFKDRFTQGLSGGERRKAALAGVLAMRPELLLLDEPTAGLDPQARHKILQLLRGLNEREGMTLAIATHSMDDVAELANQVCVLDGGRVVGNGSPRDIFSMPEFLTEHGLEAPAVASLMRQLRSRGADVPVNVLDVRGALAALNDARVNK
jgi:energy-coupling factor transport system ATP-binding protein